MTEELLDFYGLSYGEEVRHFLDTHTRNDSGTESSTYRDSKKTPFNWIKKLSYENVENIQKSCKTAMELWGYKKMYSSSDLNSFNPISIFPKF